MIEAEKRFKQYLSEHQYKLTPQRKIILQAARELKGHFDADRLYDESSTLDRSVSRASVYRTIPLLVEAGLIMETMRNQSKTSYENVSEGSYHAHLICATCGKIIEFKNDELMKLQSKICQHFNFKPTEHMMAIKGYCKKCQSKKN
jgi:Fur family ferric uptake transcriptional regulator